MTNTSCELVWMKYLLNELDVHHDGLMRLQCDNQATKHGSRVDQVHYGGLSSDPRSYHRNIYLSSIYSTHLFSDIS
jgi:hypothetical protein